MRIGRRAKGFFFTLLVVVLFFLVLLSTRAYTKQFQASGGLEATKAREDSLRGAVESMEADAARVAHCHGKSNGWVHCVASFAFALRWATSRTMVDRSSGSPKAPERE